MIKREGMEINSKLDEEQVNKIAKIVSKKICYSFEEHNFNENDIINLFSRIDMYIAKMPEDSAASKYSYKTNTIYLGDNIDFNNIDTLVIHECIHAIQEVKNNKGKVVKLGLFDLTHNKGQGINEAAVQLMASKATKTNVDTVKYYNLDFKTESPLYYPIETALINQIIYFIGPYPVFHSTIYGDDIFKKTFIAKSSQKVFEQIERNFDLLIRYEELLGKYSGKMNMKKTNTNKINKILEKINYTKNAIANLTLETQNLILESCFSCEFNLIKDKDSLNTFQNRLYDFSKILISNDSYDFYNKFYCDMMNNLEEKREIIKVHGKITNLNNLQTDLLNIGQETYGMSFFQKLFSKLKLLFENARIKEKN